MLEEVEKQYKRRVAQKMGKMSDSLPSVSLFPLISLFNQSSDLEDKQNLDDS